jgi:Tat protein secretion system quality control protein TatD with DNase activity
MTPSKSHVKNMTKWFKIRQKAIDDAKKMTTHENVFVYHYIEVNLATKGMEGEVCVSESVLPKVNVDFVSYSSYEAIKNKNFEGKKQTLTDILNYLEGKLKPKKNLPFKRRVFIGEYGYHANKKNPQTFQKQFEETKEIMQIALELDLPFALHWTMYNNEYAKNGDSKQMSLISEEGEKRPLYFFHQNYYKRMNAFLKEYKIKNNSYPDSEAFKKEALNILKTL